MHHCHLQFNSYRLMGALVEETVALGAGLAAGMGVVVTQ